MRRIVIIALLLAILIGFLLFSDSGLQAVQYVADHNRDASWAPLVYYDIAQLHAIAGRPERSVEVFDLMINVYWDEGGKEYVENKYGEYYAGYAFFYKAENLERIAGDIMEGAYELRQDGDIEGYEGLREEALGHYKSARIAYIDFMTIFGLTHELFTKANGRQDQLRETIYEISRGT